VNVNGDPSWTLAQWRQLLDPLLQPQPSTMETIAEAEVITPKKHHKKAKCTTQRAHKTRTFHKKATDCPAGEPACAYLPGKVECCLPGEMCIPNVGCRC